MPEDGILGHERVPPATKNRWTRGVQGIRIDGELRSTSCTSAPCTRRTRAAAGFSAPSSCGARRPRASDPRVGAADRDGQWWRGALRCTTPRGPDDVGHRPAGIERARRRLARPRLPRGGGCRDPGDPASSAGRAAAGRPSDRPGIRRGRGAAHRAALRDSHGGAGPGRHHDPEDPGGRPRRAGSPPARPTSASGRRRRHRRAPSTGLCLRWRCHAWS